MAEKPAPVDALTDPVNNTSSLDTSTRRGTWKKITIALTFSVVLLASYAVWPLYV